MENELHYDFQNFLLSNGNIADKVRLITAGYNVPIDILTILEIHGATAFE